MIHNSTDLHPFQPVADNCRICIRKINTNELDILWHKGKSEKLLKKRRIFIHAISISNIPRKPILQNQHDFINRITMNQKIINHYYLSVWLGHSRDSQGSFLYKE